MPLLAIDTSTGACSAALLNEKDRQIQAFRHAIMPRGHAEALALMVRDVMREAGCTMAALRRIAVTTGPGTFTGVRIGLAFARALGAALGLPVTGISTLQAIAANANASSPVAAIMDARRGEVYMQLFTPQNQPASTAQVLGIAEAAALLPGGELTLIGSGARLVVAKTNAPSNWHISSESPFPDARKIAMLAADEAIPDQPPGPVYLRAPDAKLSQKPPLARQKP